MRQYHLYSILALKKRAKDGGRNFSPVEHTTIHKYLSHLAVESSGRQMLVGQFDIYIRKSIEVFINIAEPLFFRCVQRFEQLHECGGKVPSIFLCLLVKIIVQLATFIKMKVSSANTRKISLTRYFSNA